MNIVNIWHDFWKPRSAERNKRYRMFRQSSGTSRVFFALKYTWDFMFRTSNKSLRIFMCRSSLTSKVRF